MNKRQPHLIQLDKNLFQYEDFYGKKSQFFFLASEYKNGFAKVKETKNSLIKQRDMLGRLSSLKTISGVYFYRFVQGQMSFDELPEKYFLDDGFLEGVKLAMLDKLSEKIQQKTQNGQHIDIRWVKKEKDRVIDACNKKRETALSVSNNKPENILGG